MNRFDIIKQNLLDPAELCDSQLQELLGNVLVKNIDMADLYFQAIQHESWYLEDNIIKNASFNVAKGVGVRAVSAEKTGFAYCDDINLAGLIQATQAAKTIAVSGKDVQKISVPLLKNSAHTLYTPENPLQQLTSDEKVQLLQDANQYARNLDSKVKQVNVGLSGLYEIVYVINSNGSFGADIRPLVRLNVDIIAEHNGRRERGFAGGGGRFHYAWFRENNAIQDYVDEAVRQALVNLDAVDAPAGTMPVILGPGWPGVLLHEAIGHGLEGDFNRKGSSAFSNRLGERVATPQCTVVDDGTLANRRGSLNMDDEGTPTQCTVLIENGILKNYMQDTLNAKLMGMKSTGNARRESYAHLPMPRMTNTYMLNGKYPKEEILASVKSGLYAVNFGGGQVDITSGKFVFSASEAYLIENGKITKPVKGATLIGNGPDVLTKVSMVGNDLALDSGVGVCGKEGQSVPVGVGQPTLKIDSLTVGGTNG